jgi:hypothetical protein
MGTSTFLTSLFLHSLNRMKHIIRAVAIHLLAGYIAFRITMGFLNETQMDMENMIPEVPKPSIPDF